MFGLLLLLYYYYYICIFYIYLYTCSQSVAAISTLKLPEGILNITEELTSGDYFSVFFFPNCPVKNKFGCFLVWGFFFSRPHILLSHRNLVESKNQNTPKYIKIHQNISEYTVVLQDVWDNSPTFIALQSLDLFLEQNMKKKNKKKTKKAFSGCVMFIYI